MKHEDYVKPMNLLIQTIIDDIVNKGPLKTIDIATKLREIIAEWDDQPKETTEPEFSPVKKIVPRTCHESAKFWLYGKGINKDNISEHAKTFENVANMLDNYTIDSVEKVYDEIEEIMGYIDRNIGDEPDPVLNEVSKKVDNLYYSWDPVPRNHITAV